MKERDTHSFCFVGLYSLVEETDQKQANKQDQCCFLGFLSLMSYFRGET